MKYWTTLLLIVYFFLAIGTSVAEGGVIPAIERAIAQSSALQHVGYDVDFEFVASDLKITGIVDSQSTKQKILLITQNVLSNEPEIKLFDALRIAPSKFIYPTSKKMFE